MVACRAAAILALLLALLAVPALAVSKEREVEIGREAARRFEARYPPVRDPALQQRAFRIAHALVPYSGRTEISYQIKVVQAEEINAMALPGGFLYVTRPLMQEFPDPELAFVIGHEIAHVAKRHHIQAAERTMGIRFGLVAVAAILSGGKISEGTANTLGAVDMVLQAQFSQGDELEADREGIRMMARAGWDPHHSVWALRRLQAHGGELPGFINTLVGSHPLTSDRIEQADREATRLKEEGRVGGPSPVAAAGQPLAEVPREPPTPRSAGTRFTLNREYEGNLAWALERRELGLRARWDLVEEARERVLSPQASAFSPAGGLLALEIPASGLEYRELQERLVDREVPRVLARHPGYTAFGLAVASGQGRHRVVVLFR